MDKETLSNYGWIVICVLVLAVMIALATPFGDFIANGVKSTTQGLFSTSQNAMNTAFSDLGVQIEDQTFEEEYQIPTIDMSTVSSVLEENDWATIQAVAKANKTAEAGWSIGDTKSVEINGETYDATIIGINHEGVNGITFMILSSGGIGDNVMNEDWVNAGGWEASEIRAWLNGDIYNSMSNKDYIKSVSKMTNNTGYQGTTATSTSDKVFLLSPKEAGVADDIADWDWYPEEYKPVLEMEGNTYAWFAEGGYIDDWLWLRSPYSDYPDGFFDYDHNFNGLYTNGAGEWLPVYPAFVIG